MNPQPSGYWPAALPIAPRRQQEQGGHPPFPRHSTPRSSRREAEVGPPGIEPGSPPYQSGVMPLDQGPVARASSPTRGDPAARSRTWLSESTARGTADIPRPDGWGSDESAGIESPTNGFLESSSHRTSRSGARSRCCRVARADGIRAVPFHCEERMVAPVVVAWPARFRPVAPANGIPPVGVEPTLQGLKALPPFPR